MLKNFQQVVTINPSEHLVLLMMDVAKPPFIMCNSAYLVHI